MQNEVLYTKYEVAIQHICDKYVNEYKNNFPDERTMDTAKQFMDNHYDKYRKEVAQTAVDIMHEAGIASEVSAKILNQNSLTIGKLFSEIMKLSSDLPEGFI